MADSGASLLPHALALHVFSLLPADDHARAACVCRGWHTTLEEPSLWTRLDLSPSSGVRVRVTDAALAAAAGKARGQLAALDVSGCDDVTFDALLAVVQANGGALRELCAGAPEHNSLQFFGAGRIERLLQAAPQLIVCHAEVLNWSSVANARRTLRNEPPFQPLRMRALCVDSPGGADEAAVCEVAADIAAHASLRHLELPTAPLGTPAALGAVVDAALAGQMHSLCLLGCRLSPASAPALSRLLLGSGTLTELSISQLGQQLLDGPSAALLADALRANNTLHVLSLVGADIWLDPDAAVALLGACTGHPSLRTLNVARNCVLHVGAAAGAAFGALIAANAPALTQLDVSFSRLGDAGLRPLLVALRGITHLRELNVSVNGMDEAFTADVLLPAVRANTSLLALHAESNEEHPGAVDEAIALVAARSGDGDAV
jgi:hypothetical protein